MTRGTSFSRSCSNIREHRSGAACMILFVLVVLAAVAFEYINGFHDAANAIATVVSTKVLTPRAGDRDGGIF